MASSPCRVLLIEDNSGDTRLLKHALSRSSETFELFAVTSLAEGLQAATKERWDVVLSDLSLPDCSGLDAVRQLREHAADLPIIVLTGFASDETALQSLEHGAQDYLVKDSVNPEILRRAIRYAIQRQKSATLRRLLDQLRASKRTLAKKNRRLARLYKTAHRFVDNVSHEFRTPLTVINEYVSLMRDGAVGPLNEEQERMLDVLGDRAEDLNNMVDDMLDVSKLEAGMLGLWRRDCRIDDIVAHVRSSLVRKANVKGVSLQFDIPEGLPEIFCDDEKIGRVVINLTVNAIKFCGEPGRVQIWARFDEERREVLVGVTDNGDGISPDNLEVIFNRFKQIGGNPRGSTKGVGLGLNIAKELVQINLGDLSVRSTVGRGSTFWFSVPIADPCEILARYVDRIGGRTSARTALSLVLASLPENADAAMGDDVHTFLNTLLRRHDLLVRIDAASWLFAMPCEQDEANTFFQRAEESRETINRNRFAAAIPAVAMESLGTWLIPDDRGAFLEAVGQTARVPEACAR